MFKKAFYIVLLIIASLSQEPVMAAKHKDQHRSSHTQSSKHSKLAASKKKRHGKSSASHSVVNKKGKKNKKGAKRKGHSQSIHEQVADQNKRAASQEMIALNQEKKRVSDSVHKQVFSNVSKEEEGYFATYFTRQKQAANFQTLEGTAAVFKSVSGWEDKKFYVLTNELPVGTLVRVTTPDFKSICAKVISALPDVSATIKYRLNDAAAAILGITNKTFPISVTY